MVLLPLRLVVLALFGLSTAALAIPTDAVVAVDAAVADRPGEWRGDRDHHDRGREHHDRDWDRDHRGGRDYGRGGWKRDVAVVATDATEASDADRPGEWRGDRDHHDRGRDWDRDHHDRDRGRDHGRGYGWKRDLAAVAAEADRRGDRDHHGDRDHRGDRDHHDRGRDWDRDHHDRGRDYGRGGWKRDVAEVATDATEADRPGEWRGDRDHHDRGRDWDREHHDRGRDHGRGYGW